jgi:Flp pilus assembly protein CpaB
MMMVCLAVMATLAGCGSKDSGQDDTDVDGGGTLSPPAWLIGNWEPQSGNGIEDIKVTTHNVVINSGNLDFSDQIERKYLNVEEIINGSVYILAYTSNNQVGFGGSYTFEPSGNGKMIVTSISTYGSSTFDYVKN